MSGKMEKIADDVWLLPYELKALGVNIGRNVTVIRLKSGKLVIHSTAPFTEADVSAITGLGEPGWLVEGMIDHDTFSAEGRKAFPGIPFLAPPTFRERVDFEVENLDGPPHEWLSEVEVIPVDGAPGMAESVLFHHPSGTLIVCDLLFHFPDPPSLWAKFLLGMGLGFDPSPGFSKRLKLAIKDKPAFCKSVANVMALPIERIVPGHGSVLEDDAKKRAARKFAEAGYL